MGLAPGLLLAAEEGAPNPVIPAPAEIVIGLIVFGLLFWLIYRVVVPRFEATYAARTEAIAGGIAKAEAAQAEAQAALAQYRAQLEDAQAEAARLREQARADAQAIIEEQRARAQEEYASIIRRGEEQLRGERQSLVAELRREIGQLSVDLAERIVGEAVDAGTQSRVVDRFLGELDAAAPSGTAS